MRIARVFPRRTKRTPDDALAFVDIQPPGMLIDDVDEVHVSVAFSWDIARAEQMAEAWKVLGVPVKVGGPAFDVPGGEFVPGMYLKHGNVITSRGCPNRCWHCPVPKREGYQLREYAIKDGWNIMDDNLLACSDEHVREVFAMLARQKHRPVFSGGLEAAKLKAWHAEELRKLHPDRMYFAYDTPDDYEPLVEAGKILRSVGFTVEGHRMACYVLIGYEGDAFERAQRRLEETVKAGFFPFAMLYTDPKGKSKAEWKDFRRMWTRPAIIASITGGQQVEHSVEQAGEGAVEGGQHPAEG